MDFREADVADSTDWLGTSLACLMPVEQALRCHVCKDFYNSPMITSCNHTFCSLCIRRCLSADGRCPLCRMSDQESKLRGNWALREAIDAFCRARPVILEVARTPAAPEAESEPDRERDMETEAEAEMDDRESPRRERPTTPVKRKAALARPGGSGSGSGSGGDAGPQAKRTRTSTRLSKTKAAEAVASMVQHETFAGSPERRLGADGDMDYQPDDGLVACPICWTRMKSWQVDRHIDTTCSGSPQKPKKEAVAAPMPIGGGFRTRGHGGGGASASGGNARKNPFKTVALAAAVGPPPERMASLSYSLLSDTALRKKMAALGLSTSGPRPLLERRHKEWTTIWNANCDSARPKRKADLLHDLDVWERTVGSSISMAFLASASGGGSGGSGSGNGGSVLLPSAPRAVVAASQQAALIRDKDFDGAAWAAKHNESFQDLIANARKSRSKAASTTTAAETTATDTTAAETTATDTTAAEADDDIIPVTPDQDQNQTKLPERAAPTAETGKADDS